MTKLLYIMIMLSFLTACQSAKDALTLKKKESSDEFLVEKKSPLVLPPDYGELPLPKELKKENQNNELKVSTGQDELKINETIKNTKPTTLEKSVLEKIK